MPAAPPARLIRCTSCRTAEGHAAVGRQVRISCQIDQWSCRGDTPRPVAAAAIAEVTSESLAWWPIAVSTNRWRRSSGFSALDAETHHEPAVDRGPEPEGAPFGAYWTRPWKSRLKSLRFCRPRPESGEVVDALVAEELDEREQAHAGPHRVAEQVLRQLLVAPPRVRVPVEEPLEVSDGRHSVRACPRSGTRHGRPPSRASGSRRRW